MTGFWEPDRQRAKGLAARVGAITGVIVLCNMLASLAPVSSSMLSSSAMLFAQTASKEWQDPPKESKDPLSCEVSTAARIAPGGDAGAHHRGDDPPGAHPHHADPG